MSHSVRFACAVLLLPLLGFGSGSASDDFPGSFAVPDSDVRMKVGGYVKLDAIYDYDGMGSTDFFSPPTIPTDGSGVENTRIHARQTRVSLDARGPSRLGTVRGYAEGDFFGSGNAFRLRHGYGTVSGLLAGQTWTTFMDESALPPTLDFEEPQAMVFARVAQIRWTQDVGESGLLAIALEEPSGSVSSSAGAGTTESPWPFLMARARRNGGRGHVQLAAFTGGVRFRSAAGSSEDIALWGVSASTSVRVLERDRLIIQATWGEGTAAFRGGTVAGPDAQGNLSGLPEGGGTVSYQHFWTKTLSSNAVANYGSTDNSAGQAGGEIKTSTYAALNLVKQLTDRASVGVEFLYGEREDKDGAKGHNRRLQFSTRVNLP